MFVTKNPGTIERVIQQLVDWAKAALEASSEKPTLPHVILVLNAVDLDSDPPTSDVEGSTLAIFQTVSQAVHHIRKLKTVAGSHRARDIDLDCGEPYPTILQ